MSVIVILDDRATNRQIFSRLAASIESGVTVRAFADPESALDWMRAHTPELIELLKQAPSASSRTLLQSAGKRLLKLQQSWDDETRFNAVVARGRYLAL